MPMLFRGGSLVKNSFLILLTHDRRKLHRIYSMRLQPLFPKTSIS